MLWVVASMAEVFRASIAMLPVVVMELLVMYALAPLNTRLVAMTPLTARDVPDPKALPPDEEAVLSAAALMVAVSSAVMANAPAVTTALLI